MSIFDFVSPIFNAFGVHMQNQANAEQADLNRQFQERMSNTAHQREVADLRAAGLNPILSANSGASSPSGSVSAPAQNMFGNINSAYSLHLQEQSMKQQLDLQRAQIHNINSQTAMNAKQLSNSDNSPLVQKYLGNAAARDLDSGYKNLRQSIVNLSAPHSAKSLTLSDRIRNYYNYDRFSAFRNMF